MDTPGWIARMIDRVPIATYYGLVLLLCLLIFCSAATMGAACMSLPLMGVLFIAWVVQVVLFLARRGEVKRSTVMMRLLGPVVLILLMMVIDETGLSFRFFWWISKPQLNRLAEQVMAAPAGTEFPEQTVGVFSASDIQRIPEGMQFRSDYGHPFDWNGFAYIPVSSPATMFDRPFRYVPIGDGWYRCYGD